MKWNGCTHILNDSIVQNINTLTARTYVGNKDIYMSFNYERAFFRTKKDTVFFVTFWAFKELDHMKVGRGEVLEPHSRLPVSIRYGYKYNDITINVYNKSDNIKLINGKNYKGFLGDLNRVSFSNEKEDHDIFIDYKPKRPILFLVAKIDSALYLITINSEIKFDESILSIIDFK